MSGRKIPRFKTAEEEVAFWEKHSLAEFWEETKELDVEFVDARAKPTRTTILLPRSERERIRKLADSAKVSMAEFIRQAIRDRLDRQEQRPDRRA